MAKLWRCYACKGPGGAPGLDFEGPRPACPGCGADALKDPRFERFIVAREVVHFDPPSGFPGLGKNHRACDPGRPVTGDNARATGEPSAVTCAACRASAAWKRAAGGAPEPTVPSHLDVPVTVPEAATD